MSFSLILGLLFVTLVAVLIATRHLATSATLISNILLCCISATGFLLIAELYFRFAVLYSDGFGVSLVAQKWNDKFWHPINRYGYRDVDPAPEDLRDKYLVFVVGDSFAAGKGIERIEERFSHSLSEQLRQARPDLPVAVVTLAENGWGPLEEYDAVERYPLAPKLVVISYYVNDIGDAARAHNLNRPSYSAPLPEFLKPLVNRSHFFNWLYWTFNRLNVGDRHWSFLDETFANEAVWETHTAQLQRIVDLARQRSAQIAFVVWPNLSDVSRSLELTKKVAGYLESQQVPALDLSPILVSRSPESMIVSTMDAHPNAALHHEVGNLLAQFLEPLLPQRPAEVATSPTGSSR